MSLVSLLKKGSLRGTATATPAIFATPAPLDLSTIATVATVATVAVAKRDELAANDPEPPSDPQAWRQLAAAYHAHHFNCPTCIAAGSSNRYGQRCGAGIALWQAYCD
jgi:hypothetical protein